MADEFSIKVQNITKKFPIKKTNALGGSSIVGEKTVLSDISFIIPKGRIVGIIGENGSGKSTLFKILAKIMYPDEGILEIRGKVASILELGMGFDLEQSGRDNIETKCKAYGLNNESISKLKEKIIEFSELNEQIESPLNTYSSGMKSKLSLSIILNLDFDILIIDEALSVGDPAFNFKCKLKFDSLKKEKKTILITSHNYNMLEETCDELLWIDSGKIKEIGNPSKVYYHFKKDSLESPDTLKKLSDRGDVDSMNRLGILYRDGFTVKKDIPQSKEYFQRAIDGGSIEALINLGDILKSEGNLEESKKLYTKALKMGNLDAIIKLNDNSELDEHHYELLMKLVNDGNTSAMMVLADALDTGTGITKDNKAALEYYDKISSKYNAKSMHIAAIKYRDAIGAEKDLPKALNYLETASNAGFLKSTVELANMYRKGIEVPVDIDKSIFYYKRAAYAGDRKSISQLYSIYHDGIGIDKNESESDKWANLYSLTQKLHLVQSIADLYYRNNIRAIDKNISFSLYLYCAKNGLISSMIEVALMYRDGVGVNPNSHESAYWFTKASDLGHDGAMYELANLYLKGNGVQRDVRKCIDLLKQSTFLGNKNAPYLLGRILLDDIEGLNDRDLACQYLKISAEKGNVNAALLLNQLNTID